MSGRCAGVAWSESAHAPHGRCVYWNFGIWMRMADVAARKIKEWERSNVCPHITAECGKE